MTISAILLILAFICFLLGAVGVATPRVNITDLGLAFLTLSFLLQSGIIVSA